MRVAFKSNNTTAYVLEDLELTDKVLGKLRGGMIDLDLTEPEERLPEDFLNMLVGYDYLKELILRSLKAERPLHILLIGPPASDKSIVLSEDRTAAAVPLRSRREFNKSGNNSTSGRAAPAVPHY